MARGDGRILESIQDYLAGLETGANACRFHRRAIFLGLRLTEGIENDWSPFEPVIERFIRDGLLETHGNNLRLTSRGVLLERSLRRIRAGSNLRVIDLRSDTVTKPTAAMRRAMAEAEVGDDVYGEDPTVRRLEERVADILGKQASLFLPSGTMGNTIGIKLHTRHGEEVVCDHRAHILDWEMSMMAWFSGCLARPVPTEDGILRWSDIEPVIRPRDRIPRADGHGQYRASA